MDYSTLYQSGANTMSAYLALAAAVITVVLLWMVFVKAGEHGWAALVPFYNSFVLFKITWGNGWKFLLMLIPIANIVCEIMTLSKLSKAFGKGAGFTLGLIFLYPIFLAILALGSPVYNGVGGGRKESGPRSLNDVRLSQQASRERQNAESNVEQQ